MAQPPKRIDPTRITRSDRVGAEWAGDDARTRGAEISAARGAADLPLVRPQSEATLTKTQQQIAAEALDLANKKKGTPLPSELDTKLTDLATSYQGFRRMIPSFKPDYAGAILDTPANLESDLQDRFPGVGTKGQSDWWKDFRLVENAARNALFGASLQPNEQKAWAATTVSPGMSGEAILANLRRREDMVREGLSREVAAARAGGYRPAQIDAKLGKYVADFTPEAITKFYEGAPQRAAPETAGRAPTEVSGGEVGGEPIKGFRYSPESEAKLLEYARSDPNFTPEGYTRLATTLALTEGHIKPEQVQSMYDANLAQTQEYFTKHDRAQTPPGIDYSQIDKEAQARATPGEKLMQAARNTPESAMQLAAGLVALPKDAALSAIEGEPVGLVGLGRDLITKPGDTGGAMLDALGERYGTKEARENTFITDPLGLAADMSLPLTGGGSLLARAPGAVGRVGAGMRSVGQFLDPVPLLAELPGAARAGVSALTPNGLGSRVTEGLGAASRFLPSLTTGVPGEALRRAAVSGFDEGRVPGSGASFREGMRGETDPVSAVQQAKDAVAKIRSDASAAYRSGMVDVANDATILDFGPIDQTLTDLQKRAFYKGQVRDAAAAKAYTDMRRTVDEWKALDPAEFHTPEGMDALKQKIWDVGDSYAMGNDFNAAAVVKGVYGSVRKSIADQVPTYAATMRPYEEASELARELDKTFSLNPKASPDTTLRKLQSIMRNNANTNYGQRQVLGDILDEKSPGFLDNLAGQAMNTWTPRSLQGMVGGGGAVGGIGAILAGFPTAGAALLTGLSTTSPRLVGETAHALGRVAGKTANAGEAVGRKMSDFSDTVADLYKRYPTAALGAAQLSSLNEGMELAAEPPGLPVDDGSGLRFDPETGEVIMPDGRRVPVDGYARGGPVALDNLSRRYACGGSVRQGGRLDTLSRRYAPMLGR